MVNVINIIAGIIVFAFVLFFDRAALPLLATFITNMQGTTSWDAYAMIIMSVAFVLTIHIFPIIIMVSDDLNIFKNFIGEK